MSLWVKEDHLWFESASCGTQGGQQVGLFSLVLNLLVSQRASIGDCVAPVLPHLVAGNGVLAGPRCTVLRAWSSLALPQLGNTTAISNKIITRI